MIVLDLDKRDRTEVVDIVTRVMRDTGRSEYDISYFKESITGAPLDEVVTRALAWQVPIKFMQQGVPWVEGDWRRLSPRQRVKRRFSLWRGRYVHPDGFIELAIDEKAGVYPGDSDHIRVSKLASYLRQESGKKTKWQWFFYGGLAGIAVYLLYYFSE
jgi:hypothetical protein